MRKALIYILLTLILALSGVITYGYFLIDDLEKDLTEYEDSKLEKLTYLKNVLENDDQTELEIIRNVEEQPKDISEVFVTGWIPDWDFEDGLNSFSNQLENFNGVSPFWYDLEPNGDLKVLNGENNLALKNLKSVKNFELIPSITSFNADTLSSVLNNPDNLQNHLNQIESVVVNNNYDGIDLDYESVYLKDKELFYDFLTQVSIKMTENNKKFVFTALPKWGDDVYYPTFPETRIVFDYRRIAEIADELRLMTYEYGSRDNQYVSPVQPIEWQEDIIRYTISMGVPREKIVLGVATYSYDYTKRDLMPELSYYPVLKHVADEEKDAASAYYNETVEEIIDIYNPDINYSNEWEEAYLEYRFRDSQTSEEEERIVIFPTQDSIDARKELAAKYGIKGVAYWRIGDEVDLKY